MPSSWAVAVIVCDSQPRAAPEPPMAHHPSEFSSAVWVDTPAPTTTPTLHSCFPLLPGPPTHPHTCGPASQSPPGPPRCHGWCGAPQACAAGPATPCGGCPGKHTHGSRGLGECDGRVQAGKVHLGHWVSLVAFSSFQAAAKARPRRVMTQMLQARGLPSPA
jgi:hypothetical protein